MQKKKKSGVSAPAVKEIGMFLLTREQTALAQIAEMAEKENLQTEFWDAAGVLEICVAQKASIDVETVAENLKAADDSEQPPETSAKQALAEFGLDDEFAAEYLTQKQAVSVFAVSFPSTEEKAALAFLRKVMQATNGVLCSDSEDFSPEYE